MRRHEKEVTGRENLLAILQKCEACTLAMQDGPYPYAVPVNCACRVVGDGVEIYFHGASEGKKLSLLKRDGRVAFAMHCGGRLLPGETPCGDTYAYESVCGTGDAELVTDDTEKREILQRLLAQLGDDRQMNVPPERLGGISVFRIRVRELHGKQTKPAAQ